ncbi:hypothetical protein Cenrod_1575 [Candidatus Symbiobacter mobilis CR]|uniref:Uncharacterized protein n=1 Tax=Candidatus Symbiobacter mobilis CR TaxID=946483 RepID=U5N8L0_9BURK|nr:hypothetical protein Cenrod_1575 [Candidatus Symbiobacter mobilis CR]
MEQRRALRLPPDRATKLTMTGKANQSNRGTDAKKPRHTRCKCRGLSPLHFGISPPVTPLLNVTDGM